MHHRLISYIIIWPFLLNIFLTPIEKNSPANSHLRRAGANTTASAAVKSVNVLILDDDPAMLEIVGNFLEGCAEVKGLKKAQSLGEGLKLLSPEIEFLVVDFRLTDSLAENGVLFCKKAFEPPYNFNGKVVIYSADDKAIINELKRYPELWKRYEQGQISVQLKQGADAFENIAARISGVVRDREITALPSSETFTFEPLSISPEDIGISAETIEKFRDNYVVIADDKPFIRDMMEAIVGGFFDNIHKAATVEESVELIKSLRQNGISDDKIIVLSDYEFGTEQTGARRKDGYDLLHILRLDPKAEYASEKLAFKGHFIFISGSIISRDQIPGFNSSSKDIASEIKEAYGIDYIEKGHTEDFPILLLSTLYKRLENPYNLEEPILNPLKRRPMSKPADISFLNGAINDFETRMGFNLTSLIDLLRKISKDGEDYKKTTETLIKMRAFIDFGNVDRKLPFNKRVHDYKNRIFLAGYLLKQIQEVPLFRKEGLGEIYKNLDNLNLTIRIAQDYMARLLRLSSIVGNLNMPISFKEFINSTITPFLKDYGEQITIEQDYKETLYKDLEFPYSLTLITSYILNNALEQYFQKYGKGFKGKIYFSIDKEAGNLEISIADEAGGIPEDILPYIFKRKFSKGKPQGTGYGLFWAKRLTDTFDGTIQAENKDNGAAFTIKIPLNWQEILSEKDETPKPLIENILNILRQKDIPYAEELAEPIARQMHKFSVELASVTERREALKTREDFEALLPDYLKITEATLKNIIFEKDVLSEDIENLLLTLLVMEKDSEDISSEYLPLRQAVFIEDSVYSGILLRSKENLAKEKEGITEEQRREYQRALRIIGYAIHNLGSKGIIPIGFINSIKELSQERKDFFKNSILQDRPDDIYNTIHQYTNSPNQLSGFEDDILIIERTAGWLAAITDFAETFPTLQQKLDKELEGLRLEPNPWRERMQTLFEEAIEDIRNLQILLNRQKIDDKEFLNIASYPDKASRLYEDKESFTVAPGTRLWLKKFFLENIMLNIWRSTTNGESVSVAIAEEEGRTIFRIRYKGHIENIDTIFEPKKDRNAPWHQGPLIYDLVQAVEGEIRVQNADGKVEITLSFPLPKKRTGTILPELSEDDLFEAGVSSEYTHIDAKTIFRLIQGYLSRFPDKYIKALDVGCGYGNLVNLLNEWTIDASGIDIDPSRGEKIYKGNILYEDLIPDRIKDERFDLITATNFFDMMLSRRDQLQALINMRNLLSDTGMVVIQDWSRGLPFNEDIETAGLKIIKKETAFNSLTTLILEKAALNKPQPPQKPQRPVDTSL